MPHNVDGERGRYFTKCAEGVGVSTGNRMHFSSWIRATPTLLGYSHRLVIGNNGTPPRKIGFDITRRGLRASITQ